MHSNFALILLLALFANILNAEGLFDKEEIDVFNESETVEILPVASNNRVERLKVPFGVALGTSLLTHPLIYAHGNYLYPNWLAGARLTGEDESAVNGLVTFQPLPYNNGIKITLNATGLPAGRHSLHIHTYGDIMDGCAATGIQFPNNFLGNIEAKEDGSVSLAFLSIYVTLFGFNGIVGRSFVIHANPIDLNTALHAEVVSSPLQRVPYTVAYQNEENAVGAILACGVISILNTNVANPTVAPR